MKVNYISQLNSIANQDNQVKHILDEINKNKSTNNQMFSTDLDQQESNFKQRLQEKRLKKLPKIDEEEPSKNESSINEVNIQFLLLLEKS